MELRRESLTKLRARLLAHGEVDPGAVEALQRDPRAGARALAALLLRRGQREAREQSRLGRLFRFERALRARGLAPVAGLDEVGVGPLAGPVVAAAVILPESVELPGLDDSKKLPRPRRERLDVEIRRVAISVSIGLSTREEVDRLNIYQATLLAMRRAFEGLSVRPEFVLVDGRARPEFGVPIRAIIGGDRRSASIAAASIVAKVWRDARMRELDQRFPGYGFARNAGYGTAQHLLALSERGPSPEHRRSFAPVRRALAGP